MKYTLVTKDITYGDQLYQYYLKHYRQKLHFDVNGSYSNEDIVISAEPVENHEKQVFLKSRNDHQLFWINKFQKGDAFFEFLLHIDWRQSDHSTRIFALINGCGGAGATTLALNLTHALAKESRCFYLNLDYLSPYEHLLEQSQSHSLSEILFLIRRDRIEELIDQGSAFGYLNQASSLQDVIGFQPDEINRLIEHLKHLGYAYIILDLSKRYDLMDRVQADYKGIVITHHKSHHETASKLLQSYPNTYVVINKRRMDKMVSEQCLKPGTYHYVDYDHYLERGDQSWQSQRIGKQMMQIISKL